MKVTNLSAAFIKNINDETFVRVVSNIFSISGGFDNSGDINNGVDIFFDTFIILSITKKFLLNFFSKVKRLNSEGFTRSMTGLAMGGLTTDRQA